MGLFKSDKNPCPICGSATPKLFPTKVEGQPLCKECDHKISMEELLKKELTLTTLKEHLEYRKENEALHKTFLQSQVIEFNNALFLKAKMCIDDSQGLWYFESGENSPIFKIDDLVAFRFKEDDRVVIQVDKNGYKTFPSNVDSFTKQYGGIVGGLYAFSDTINRLDGNKDNDHNSQKINAPIHQFYLEFTVSNKYWKSIKYNFGAPSLSNNNIPDFLQNYALARTIVETAAQTVAMILPGASVIASDRNTSGNGVSDVVDDIKKFKALLDMNIITQDEFDSKKKQLLGL